MKRTWRERVGWRLRCWADRIDLKNAPKMIGYSFTFELGEGIRFRTDRKGCPLAYLGDDDYSRAHDESDTAKPIDWPGTIAEWGFIYEERQKQDETGAAPKQFLVYAHNMGQSISGMTELRSLIDQGVVHYKPEPPYLVFDEIPEPGHPVYWWVQNKSPCFYKSEWMDAVGDVWVCQIHKNNSRHTVEEGFSKPCLTVDPYPKD